MMLAEFCNDIHKIANAVQPIRGEALDKTALRTIWMGLEPSIPPFKIVGQPDFFLAPRYLVVKDYTVGIKYVNIICDPTRDSNGEKRAKTQVQ